MLQCLSARLVSFYYGEKTTPSFYRVCKFKLIKFSLCDEFLIFGVTVSFLFLCCSTELENSAKFYVPRLFQEMLVSPNLGGKFMHALLRQLLPRERNWREGFPPIARIFSFFFLALTLKDTMWNIFSEEPCKQPLSLSSPT